MISWDLIGRQGLVHTWITFAYADLLFRGQNVFKHFITSLTKYKSCQKLEPSIKAKLHTNSNRSSLQDGQVTISRVKVTKISQDNEFEDIGIVLSKYKFKQYSSAINHHTCNKSTNLQLPWRCTKSNASRRWTSGYVLWYSTLFTLSHFPARSLGSEQCPIV